MTELSLRRHTGIFRLVATLISLTDIPLYFMYTGAPPQWDILTRSGGYRQQYDSHCFSSRISAGYLPRKATTGVGCDPRSRLRANVADVQHGGPIHGGWNGHCVESSDRPDRGWRARPGSIPPVGSY